MDFSSNLLLVETFAEGYTVVFFLCALLIRHLREKSPTDILCLYFGGLGIVCALSFCLCFFVR